jgi:hypothetical protein
MPGWSDIGSTAAIELILDDVEQAPMQPFNERDSLEVVRPDLFRLLFAICAVGSISSISSSCFQHVTPLF